MNWFEREFTSKIGFRRQIIWVFSCGILLLALATSMMITAISRDSLSQQFLNQNINITETIAGQSILALLYESVEAAEEVTSNSMSYQDISSIYIANSSANILFARHRIAEKPTLSEAEQRKLLGQAAASTRVEENEKYWHIISPVVNEAGDGDIFMESQQDRQVDIIGHVLVVVSKSSLISLNQELMRSNFITSIVLASLLLAVLVLLTNRMTRPLKALAELMSRPGILQSKERAVPKGSKEVLSIQKAFNTMMDELESREKALTTARDNALSTAHAKGEFAANVSHELRTPMNGIMGMLELLQTAELDEKEREYISIARKSCQNLLTLIDDILDFSKLESTKMRLHPEPFNLGQLLGEVTELLSIQAENKSIKLSYSIEDSLARVIIADPNRIRQIVINLVGNALKFTHKGNIHAQAFVCTENENSMVRVSVIDTGIGISEAAQKKIFNAFTQEDASSTRKYGGTGLGLTICHQLVALMGGEIDLESKVGEGSTFSFTFPLRYGEEKLEAPKTRSLALSNQGVLILSGNNASEVQRLADCLVEWNVEIKKSKTAKSALLATKAAITDLKPYLAVIVIPPVEDMEISDFCQTVLNEHEKHRTGIFILSKGRDIEELSIKYKNRVMALDPDIEKDNLYLSLTEYKDKRSSLYQDEARAKKLRAAHVKILIADDNRTNQLVALGMVERLGYQAKTANSGAQVLQFLKEEAFTLVLMDCKMPDMDGFTCTKKIRRLNTDYRMIPIIATTGFTDSVTHNRCREAGMNDYLHKPIDLVELDLKIEFWLEFSRQRQVQRLKDNNELADAQSQTSEISDFLFENSFHDDDESHAANPAFDHQKLSSLKSSLGDAYGKVLENTLDSIPGFLSQINVAINTKDDTGFEYFLGRTRNAALSICADPLSKLCSELDLLYKEKSDVNKVKEKLVEIEGEFARLQFQIKSQALAGESIDIHQVKQTILIVDDDPNGSFALQSMLERDGYYIICVDNGQDAISVCKNAMPDLVLMDVMMPHVNGFVACQEILKMESSHHPIILLMTALNDEQSIEKAFAAGASDFIPKPVNLMVLRKRVAHLLHSRTTEKHVHRLAYYDSLTNLPNRALFVEKGRSIVQRLDNSEKRSALLYMGLDKFKHVNDTQGHHIGDLLLNIVAQRLRGSLRTDDLIARIVGDEFAVILEKLENSESALKVANKIQRTLNQPFSFMNYQVHISCSIGITLLDNSNVDIFTVMKQADTAMSEAKSGGGDRICFYEMGMEAEMARRLELEKELRAAIENDQLILFYQPQQDLSDNKMCGAEALVRWQHPNRGMLPPFEFINLAEDTGLIIPLGSWVLDRVCRQIIEWQNDGVPVVPIAVNVSTHQIERGDLFEVVTGILNHYQVDPSLLKLEITENSLVNVDEKIIAQLDALVEHGVLLAIDDFGTGYSSLGYLKNLPVKTLKIDRCFVKDLSEGTDDASIVSAIIRLGHSLNMEIVAEGVETEEQRELLRKKKCNIIQGYFYGRPVSASDYLEFVLEQQKQHLLSS